jgi:hypothetical protein
MFPRKPNPNLIDDSMFLPLEVYQSKEVQSKVMDEEQHKKTIREMLSNVLKEKIKQRR